MREALQRWREVYDGDRVEACRAAAEVHAGDPWRVVEIGGALARARVQRFEVDVGVGARLQRVKPTSSIAVAVFRAGQPVPLFNSAGRKRRGAWDTPRSLALELVGGDDVLDPACGVGAFLVAASERGARRLRGWDVDPVALAVARVALPNADLELCSAFDRDDGADWVVCNPPYVASEHQDKELRRALVEEFPWLRGRFDLAVPFAAHAVCLARRRASLVLPSPLSSQPYAASLRREWLRRHRFLKWSASRPFGSAMVEVMAAVLAIDEGAGPMPWKDAPHAEELLGIRDAPLDVLLERGDTQIVAALRRSEVTVGELCEVDTGVVAHGPKGGKERLLRDEPAEGLVPYVDAKDMRDGRVRWLDYRPDEMHRPKRPQLFERAKILVQRLRGPHPVRAAVDRAGWYAGHTLTVVQPRGPLDLDRLFTLLTSPLMDGLLRIEKGERLDLYPNDIKGLPVPAGWLEGCHDTLEEAFGLDPRQAGRLQALAMRGHRL